MAFFALLAVLLIEQLYPLDYQRAVRAPLVRLADFIEFHMNAGTRPYAVAGWWIAAGGSVVVSLIIFLVLQSVSPLFGGLWNVLVLYWALGFREFSNDFHQFQMALRMDDLPRARGYLEQWHDGVVPETLSPARMADFAVEEAFLAAHRRVFGVLVCFLLFPGPMGAVLYRVATLLANSWGQRTEAKDIHFSLFSRRAFAVIDWFPARITSAVFAIVGDFENAVYCWRTQAELWIDPVYGRGSGIVLASGAGSLGVRLGARASVNAAPDDVRLGVGCEADVECLRRLARLLWRALLLWLLLLMLYGVAQ